MSVPAGKYGNTDSSSNPDERARHQYQISAQNSERQSYFVAWLQAIYGLLSCINYKRDAAKRGNARSLATQCSHSEQRKWGSDASVHQDGWYPWSNDAPEGEKNSREGNESELENLIKKILRNGIE
ncbi:hypothetical protein ARMSODRAFT_981521 [Armillaria solidipes]|uniref:Uncharacterized protein n=1 Tax=Armillaria solidipes TaxID=1076256 RepID=A0A2H3ARH0_9AGAR|nr:hypothetical protein ARMSODRAFT_981521 [Armillaria solidipes]